VSPGAETSLTASFLALLRRLASALNSSTVGNFILRKCKLSVLQDYTREAMYRVSEMYLFVDLGMDVNLVDEEVMIVVMLLGLLIILREGSIVCFMYLEGKENV
jgi:hypothetical protein